MQLVFSLLREFGLTNNTYNYYIPDLLRTLFSTHLQMLYIYIFFFFFFQSILQGITEEEITVRLNELIKTLH